MDAGIATVATYRPAWQDGKGRRVGGPDEDVPTLAVAAGLDALEPGAPVARVILCTRAPNYLLGNTPSVVLAGLGLPGATPFEERLGGGPAVLDAVSSATPGTLVIGVDADGPAAAGAIYLGEPDAAGVPLELRSASLPVAVVEAGVAAARVYEDPRLLRERGWIPNVRAFELDSGLPTVITGVPAKDAKKLGGEVALQERVTTTGAAGAVAAIAAAVEHEGGAHVVGLENGLSAALRVAPAGAGVRHRERGAVAYKAGEPEPSPMILALPAYERAFESKLRFVGERCPCGTLHFPRRTLCHVCGAVDAGRPEPLPRSGRVHSVVTVHMPVPGKHVPYSIAVVQLDGVDVRVLAPVTDCLPGSADVDDPGRMVLRLVAVREGVRDYGYAFQPEEDVR